MLAEDSEGRELIREISKSVVAEAAPEELELFDELLSEYFQDPTPPQPSPRASEDPLGFGLNETLVAITPAAAAMTTVVLEFLITASITAAKDESKDVLKKKVKSYLERRKKPADPNARSREDVPPLTKEQMEQVHRLALAQAIKFGVDQENAEKMAAALIGSIVLIM
jgi:hypothetical protein